MYLKKGTRFPKRHFLLVFYFFGPKKHVEVSRKKQGKFFPYKTTFLDLIVLLSLKLRLVYFRLQNNIGQIIKAMANDKWFFPFSEWKRQETDKHHGKSFGNLSDDKSFVMMKTEVLSWTEKEVEMSWKYSWKKMVTCCTSVIWFVIRCTYVNYVISLFSALLCSLLCLSFLSIFHYDWQHQRNLLSLFSC